MSNQRKDLELTIIEYARGYDRDGETSFADVTAALDALLSDAAVSLAVLEKLRPMHTAVHRPRLLDCTCGKLIICDARLLLESAPVVDLSALSEEELAL